MENVRRRRAVGAVAVVLLSALLLSACQPARPSAGRSTPVRRVLIVGDSISWGIFGSTPRVNELLVPMMSARNISTWFLGFAGDNILEPWPGQPRWIDIVSERISSWNPDVVVVQSSAFPGGRDAHKQELYLAAARELFRVAGSRGAHVYRVEHSMPPDPNLRAEHQIAEFLQEVAAGDRISAIPLRWWLEHCDRPFVSDAWHLSGSGQKCHADAVTAAVDQLRAVVG